MAGSVTCPQQPQSLQALPRSQSLRLRLRNSQSRQASQRCRSFPYKLGEGADDRQDFTKAASQVMIILRGLDNLNMIKENPSPRHQTTGSDNSNPSESLLPSVSPHDNTDYEELGNVARVEGSDDFSPTESLLPSSTPYALTDDYGEPDNLPRVVDPSGSNSRGSIEIDIGSHDGYNDFDQTHNRTRVTSLELIFMLIGLNLEMLSAGFDQASSPSKPLYALISLLLAIAAVLTCILELIQSGLKERVALPNNMVFGTLPDIFGLGLAVIQCVCSAVQYYFLHRHASNPMKLSPVPLFFFTCLVVLKIKSNWSHTVNFFRMLKLMTVDRQYIWFSSFVGDISIRLRFFRWICNVTLVCIF